MEEAAIAVEITAENTPIHLDEEATSSPIPFLGNPSFISNCATNLSGQIFDVDV